MKKKNLVEEIKNDIVNEKVSLSSALRKEDGYECYIELNIIPWNPSPFEIKILCLSNREKEGWSG